MSDKTGISWTDATWNPVTGCAKVSQGCKHCYAERDWARLSANPKAVSYYGRAFTDVACHEDRLDQPLRWQKPRMIFVNSMGDLFHESVPDAFIDRVFAVMALAEKHTFQVLTKRPERMMEWFAAGYDNREHAVGQAMREIAAARGFDNAGIPEWPLPNVWLGVSAEDQETADARIPLLMQTPATLRWVSAEPLLGPIDFEAVPVGMFGPLRPYQASVTTFNQRIKWVVVGDLVDRGPDSAGCLALLEEPWFYPVLGNHDAMLMAWIDGKTKDRRQRDYAYAFTCIKGWQWTKRFTRVAQYMPLLERVPLVRVVGSEKGRFHVAHAELTNALSNDSWTDALVR